MQEATDTTITPGSGGGTPPPAEGTPTPADGTPPADNGTNAGDGGTPEDGSGDSGDGDPQDDSWDLNKNPEPKKDDTTDKGDDGKKGEGDDGKKGEFTLVLPDGYKPDEGTLKAATAAAKQFGIDPKSMGLAMRAMDAASDKAYKAELKADAARLRDDWGTNYDDNMAETRTFVANLEGAGILAPHMKAALNSPEGVRFLYGISQLMSEDKTMAGAAQNASSYNEAQDIMKNPSNPLHEKWVNNDPEVCRKVDHALGLI